MPKGIPAGYHTLTPHLIVQDIATAIAFYKKAFGAVEHVRMEAPGSSQVMHAELQIGDSKIMLGSEMPNCGKSPSTLGGTPVTIHIYVENVDEAFKKALAAGATETMPIEEMFWGDRFGTLKDPFGHEWSIATNLRTPSPEEMQKAMEARFAQAAR